jgi:hypothetical protein
MSESNQPAKTQQKLRSAIRRIAMSKRALLATGAAGLGIVVGASTLALAQFNPWNNNNVNMRSMTDSWSAPNAVGQLASNEGIYVDVNEFKIAKGVAKGDPSAQIAKSGAREVSDGAIIFRSGNKLYIVDGRPPATTQ